MGLRQININKAVNTTVNVQSNTSVLTLGVVTIDFLAAEMRIMFSESNAMLKIPLDDTDMQTISNAVKNFANKHL